MRRLQGTRGSLLSRPDNTSKENRCKHNKAKKNIQSPSIGLLRPAKFQSAHQSPSPSDSPVRLWSPPACAPPTNHDQPSSRAQLSHAHSLTTTSARPPRWLPSPSLYSCFFWRAFMRLCLARLSQAPSQIPRNRITASSPERMVLQQLAPPLQGCGRTGGLSLSARRLDMHVVLVAWRWA